MPSYKQWQCENAIVATGEHVWPTGCYLRLMSGCCLSSVERVLVPSLGPGREHDVILTLTSPPEQGIYSAQWRMSTFTGTPFGGCFDHVTSFFSPWSMFQCHLCFYLQTLSNLVTVSSIGLCYDIFHVVFPGILKNSSIFTPYCCTS